MTKFSIGVACAALVENDDLSFALVKTPLRGWELPGGFLEPGETLGECVRREVQEEAGIVLKKLRYLGASFRLGNQPLVVHVFRARGEGRISFGDECIDAEWVSSEDLLAKISNRAQILRASLALADKPFAVTYDDQPFKVIERIHD